MPECRFGFETHAFAGQSLNAVIPVTLVPQHPANVVLVEKCRQRLRQDRKKSFEARKAVSMASPQHGMMRRPRHRFRALKRKYRHAAFGLGIHRCVGSNLARMEMIVAIEEWLKRIPDFRLDPAGKVTWSEGTVRGPRQLPVLFGKKN